LVASSGGADDLDRDVRLAVHRGAVDDARPPTAPEIARELGVEVPAVEESLERLAEDHVLVLAPGTRYVWMANPFSAIPTSFRRQAWGARLLGELHLGRVGDPRVPGCRRQHPDLLTGLCGLTPAQGWQLASAWYADRLDATLRRRTPPEAKTLFDSIGLTGEFWQLEPEVSSQDRSDTPEA
jgi:hypothetical protein